MASYTDPTKNENVHQRPSNLETGRTDDVEKFESNKSFGVTKTFSFGVKLLSLGKNGWKAYKPSKVGSPRGWQAMPYIIGNELSQKIATIGLTWNLLVYLMQYFHMEKVTASYVVNIFSGTTSLTPLLGAFIADAYLGRFQTILISSLFTLLGMVFLLLTATMPTLKPAPCPNYMNSPSLCQHASQGQLAFLFMAFIFIAIGSGGLSPCTYAFGADQFGQSTKEEKKQFQSFFNWYYFVLNVAYLLSSTVVVYIQQDISWGWGFGVPTILMTLSIVLFILGIPKYRHEPPEGSQFTGLVQVVVAAFRKRKLKLPSDPRELYEQSTDRFSSRCKLVHTDHFRFLDKAAIKSEDDWPEPRAWRLCEVHKVEELKCILKIVPIWAAGILYSTSFTQQGTFVVLQALSMDRHLGSTFQIPAASMGVFILLAMIVWLPLYDRLLLPLARRCTDDIRGISLLQRIGIGYITAALSMAVSGLVEEKRRSIAGSDGSADGSNASLHMSVFWLVPQLGILGVAETFTAIGQIEFFYDQMPVKMRSVAGAMFSLGSAVGSYGSSIVVAIVQKVTGKNGHEGWFTDNLSKSHIDYFYYLLAVLLGLNFVYFFVCARWFKYSSFANPNQSKLDESEKEDKAVNNSEEAPLPL